MSEFAEKIAKLCLDKYNSLKKTGKPTINEWTVLSGIILKNSLNELSVIALCTGTKCLSGKELMDTKLEEKGCRLSDSHAEILARRAFLRYLYSQIDNLLTNQKSEIFHLNRDKKINLKNDTSFHFFSSQTPCGDCSIIPKIESENHPSKKMKMDKNLGTEIDFEDDIHRTGAKCISTEERQDLKLPGKNYHVFGPLRTKPGRGDRTLSLSCSDKMAKWNVVGVQGSLLSLLIPEIKFDTITIGGDSPFSLEAMERGLFKRFNLNSVTPRILQSSLAFEHKKGGARKNPCPSSVIWCSVSERNLEVAVDGRKQGVTKNKRGIYLLVSRRGMFKTFLKIYDKYSELSNLPRHPKKITYFHCKQWSRSYKQLWQDAKMNAFRKWPLKPLILQNFVL